MSKLIEYDKKNKTAKFLIGTDEAGRGPAAGDVYAAAVCFIKEPKGLLEELNDSKKLTEKKRNELFDLIKNNAIYSIQSSSVSQIDKKNILNASLDAMKRACEDVIRQLENEDVEVFVDGNRLIKEFQYKQKFIIGGDATSASIAAASILAKVTRDREMEKLDEHFPQYHWKENKGYLTASHIDAIKKYGITQHHRKLFVRNILEAQKTEQLSLLK